MPPRKNPLSLNKLQLRTLALLQLIARDPDLARLDEASGEGVLYRLPHAHGDHLHIGRFAVSARDASGIFNPAVGVALRRKGLVRVDGPAGLVVTAAGLAYDTGLGEAFAPESDH